MWKRALWIAILVGMPFAGKRLAQHEFVRRNVPRCSVNTGQPTIRKPSLDIERKPCLMVVWAERELVIYATDKSRYHRLTHACDPVKLLSADYMPDRIDNLAAREYDLVEKIRSSGPGPFRNSDLDWGDKKVLLSNSGNNQLCLDVSVYGWGTPDIPDGYMEIYSQCPVVYRIVCQGACNRNVWEKPCPFAGHENFPVEFICFFHGTRCAARFFDVVQRDSDGRFFIFESANGGLPHQPRKYPETGRGEKQRTGEPSYPPVWVRIPVALIMGLGSNGIFILGALYLDNRGRWWRSAYMILAALTAIGGCGLMLSLGIPATWGWWL